MDGIARSLGTSVRWMQRSAVQCALCVLWAHVVAAAAGEDSPKWVRVPLIVCVRVALRREGGGNSSRCLRGLMYVQYTLVGLNWYHVCRVGE